MLQILNMCPTPIAPMGSEAMSPPLFNCLDCPAKALYLKPPDLQCPLLHLFPHPLLSPEVHIECRVISALPRWSKLLLCLNPLSDGFCHLKPEMCNRRLVTNLCFKPWLICLDFPPALFGFVFPYLQFILILASLLLP